MKHSFWLVLFVISFLNASGSSRQQDADFAAVQASGVSSAVYDKMRFENTLTINDIKALSKAQVSDEIILRYLKRLCTVYYLRDAEKRDLRDAGVSSKVINYMAKTPSLFRPTAYPPGSGIDPYWFGPNQTRNGY